MSVEDIDFLKKNSVKDNFIFLVDSKKRNLGDFPDPNYYVIDFPLPFKNVIGIEVIEANIPRTMYSVDIYNNSFLFYIGTTNDPLVLNGLDIENTNMNIFTKLEITPSSYTLQTFIPTFNTLMLLKHSEDPINYPSPIQVRTFSNPPELTNIIVFFCEKPFILNMYDSTLADTIGFSLNTKEQDNNIKYKYFRKYEQSKDKKFLKFYHSIKNESTGYYEITSPGIVFFIGEKYIILRSPEIEQHSFGSLGYNTYNQGIAKFKVNSIGYNDERIELSKIPTREFHPIGKLSKLTFRFETSNGQLYDYKGVDHMITYVVYYYKPKLAITEDFKPILNPNYKNNYNEYRYTNIDQELDIDEDEIDEDEFSRDDMMNTYKMNEFKYKQQLKQEQEEDEFEDIDEEEDEEEEK